MFITKEKVYQQNTLPSPPIYYKFDVRNQHAYEGQATNFQNGFSSRADQETFLSRAD